VNVLFTVDKQGETVFFKQFVKTLVTVMLADTVTEDILLKEAKKCAVMVFSYFSSIIEMKKREVVKLKLHGLSLRANYTDRATAACRRSDCQLVRIESAAWSA
jgi:hypothetical protein